MNKQIAPLVVSLIALCLVSCAKNTEPSKPAAAEKSVAEPKATTAKPSAMKKGSVTVLEAVACRSIAERAPVEPGTAFKSDVGRVYVFTKLSNEGTSDESIQHIWYFNGAKVASVTLPVRGENWRTFSSKSVQSSQKGPWKVEVVHSSGEVITTVPFTIE